MVLVISLSAGVVLVVGGGLVMYMANLVHSAYELKVQINTEVDERLNRMAEEMDKKSRWIKRDLLEEIEKIKIALQTDNARKIQELSAPLLQRIEEYDALLRSDHDQWVKAIESDRQMLVALDNRTKSLIRKIRKTDDIAPMPTPVPLEQSAVLPASIAMDGNETEMETATEMAGTQGSPAPAKNDHPVSAA